MSGIGGGEGGNSLAEERTGELRGVVSYLYFLLSANNGAHFFFEDELVLMLVLMEDILVWA